MSEKLEVKASSIFGRGCFARVPLAKRKKIAAYAGEPLRGRRLIEARLSAQRVLKIIHISDDLAIDGQVGGDETAYINHSCEPNAYMRVAPGNNVIFFTLRDIKPGEEITINYRDPEILENCQCGAPRCRSKAKRK